MHESVNYQIIWSRLYILFGVLFGLLFIFGALILKDYTIFFNLIASFIIIYIGYGMLNRPYAKYNAKELIIYGLTGHIRKQYTYASPKEITLKNDRLYLHGKRLKINKWIVDKADWKRLREFYESDLIGLDELKEN